MHPINSLLKSSDYLQGSRCLSRVLAYRLSLFMISQRTKEIAIRRVLGSSISNMVGLFSKDFITLIIIANLVTLPVTYFVADLWLDNFAFRINDRMVDVCCTTLTLLVISISQQVVSEPVNSFRYNPSVIAHGLEFCFIEQKFAT